MDQNYQYKPFSEEVTSTSVFGKSNFHLFDFGVGTSDCNSPKSKNWVNIITTSLLTLYHVACLPSSYAVPV